MIMPTDSPKVDFFYGDKKVKELLPGFEPGTKRVVLEDGAQDLPSWEASACITNWPTDLTEIRNLRCIYIAEKIYEVFKELNVRVTQSEMQFLFQKMMTTMENLQKNAMLGAFGVSQEGDIRIGLLEKKLKK